MWRLWSLRLMVFNRIPRSKVNPSSNLAKSVHLNSLWMSPHIAANSFWAGNSTKDLFWSYSKVFLHTPTLFLYGMGDPRGYIHQICFCFFLFQPRRYPGGARPGKRSGSQVVSTDELLSPQSWPMNKILLASRIEKKHQNLINKKAQHKFTTNLIHQTKDPLSITSQTKKIYSINLTNLSSRLKR